MSAPSTNGASRTVRVARRLNPPSYPKAELPAGLPSGMTSRHTSETGEHYSPPWLVESARLALGAIDLDPATTREANAVIKAGRFFTREDNGYRREWHGRTFLNPPGGMSDNQERVVRQKCGVTGSCGLAAGVQGKPGHKHEGVESGQKKWWFKLAREWRHSRVTSGVFVMFSVELLQSTQSETPTCVEPTEVPEHPPEEGVAKEKIAFLPIPLDFAICFPRTRVKYIRADGKVGDQPPHASGIVLVSDDKETTRRFVDAFSVHGRVILGPTALRTLGR